MQNDYIAYNNETYSSAPININTNYVSGPQITANIANPSTSKKKDAIIVGAAVVFTLFIMLVIWYTGGFQREPLCSSDEYYCGSGCCQNGYTYCGEDIGSGLIFSCALGSECCNHVNDTWWCC